MNWSREVGRFDNCELLVAAGYCSRNAAHLISNLIPSQHFPGTRDSIVYRWAVAFFVFQGFLQFVALRYAPPPFSRIGESLDWTAGMFLTVFGIPFGLLLPNLKVNEMADQWRVPKATFLLSRPLARLTCSTAIGLAVGGLLAVPFVGFRLIILQIAMSVIASCLAIATHRRFDAHSCTEWTMPNQWYKVLRPLIRGSRPDV
ncbi:hypothetical protein [Rhodopirellula sp. MGV]|uniref:hypothetical protein n=1 Tax=Rhodopirellula sp. MGV TaxID=2023130 RepID=UPI00117A016A|nr:hypothetical protein [Rhodopirellula sp. MGV]